MKNPHNKGEIKVLLEILVVCAVLVLVLIGIYYFEPSVVGLVTVTKQINYTDKVSLEFKESGTYVWKLANPGNLKSVKIDGSIIGNGSTKVYIENKGIRYLLFDGNKTIEKGGIGITGLVVKEKDKNEDKNETENEEAKDEIRTEIEGTLNEEQKIIFNSLVKEINKTRNDIEIELETDERNLTIEINGGITEEQNGFVNNLSSTLENSTEKVKIKIEAEFVNNAPIWNSDAESFIINGSLSLNLSIHFYDADNDDLSYSYGNTSNVSVSINGSIITFIADSGLDETRPIILAAYDGKDITYKTVNLVIRTMVELQPLKKMINIAFEYDDDKAYDSNNDGLESKDGVIDFSVKDTTLNWDANEENLCTRYEIYSEENKESNFVCLGNNNCCNLVNMESSKSYWDESLYISYGAHGSTNNNIVFAQIIYADYNLSADIPYSDIAYSLWANLSAKFIEGILEFEDVCVDTCIFDGNATSYELIVEVKDIELRVDKIDYIIEERITNKNPILLKEIENISVVKNEPYKIDLNQYFYDEDNDEITYSHLEMENITISFDDNRAYISPSKDFIGIRFTYIEANDSYGKVSSNVFKINVKDKEKPSIEILNVTKDGNLSVIFQTKGISNLTIMPTNMASFAEIYNDNLSTANSIEALSLKCGNFEVFDKEKLIETDNVLFTLLNGSKAKLWQLMQESATIKSIEVQDYSCSNISYYHAKLLDENYAHIIRFGDETKVIGVVTTAGTFEIRDKEDNKLAMFDSYGNVKIKGNLTENAVDVAENNFIVYNSSNGVNLIVYNPSGNMYIKGAINENLSILNPEPNSFIIQNNNGDAVAYISDNGSIFLRGMLTENVFN